MTSILCGTFYFLRAFKKVPRLGVLPLVDLSNSAVNAMPKKQARGSALTKVESLDPNSPVSVDCNGLIKIRIVAKPGAKKNGITGSSPEGIGVQINAPPRDGEANEELISFISSVLGIRKGSVELCKGGKSRLKVLSVSSDTLTVDAVISKLLQKD